MSHPYPVSSVRREQLVCCESDLLTCGRLCYVSLPPSPYPYVSLQEKLQMLESANNTSTGELQATKQLTANLKAVYEALIEDMMVGCVSFLCS